jgi:hypothetical protein
MCPITVKVKLTQRRQRKGCGEMPLTADESSEIEGTN